MEIEITVKGEKKKIDFPMKGKHSKKIWEKIKQLSEDKKEEILTALELFDTLEKIACDLSGMNSEELSELDIDDYNKITRTILEKSLDAMGFMKPSMNQASSVPKARVG